MRKKYLEYEVHYDTRPTVRDKDAFGEINNVPNPDYGKLLSKKLTDRGHVTLHEAAAKVNNSYAKYQHRLYELAEEKVKEQKK
ncbi:MAG: hypothetical protein H8E34_10445 [Bacteroidetes bacterium]|nr:hypothetical protein [Bacteroidota bacterium]